MTKQLVQYLASTLLLAGFTKAASATSFQFVFSGTGVSGNVTLTYGAATDGRYSQAYEIQGLTGTFTDTTLGLQDVQIQGVEGLNRVAPEPTNLLTPNDFSGYAVAQGLSPESHGKEHYDNLLYPGGSPQTASDYPFFGGFLDIYGLMFDIGNGEVVNLWSDGVLPHTSGPEYDLSVASHAEALDYVTNLQVAQTPEPEA